MAQIIKIIFINKDPCLVPFFFIPNIMQTHLEIFQYAHAQHTGCNFASPVQILQVALHNEVITWRKLLKLIVY